MSEQFVPANVTVIGAGTMGHGIAQVCAVAGATTRLFDTDVAALDRARQRVASNLQGAVDRGKLSEPDRDAALARLQVGTDFDAAVSGADFVVEAIHEDLNAKRALFQSMESLVADDAVLATNTSSLSIGKIAEASGRPGRVVGMHFFNPVHIMKLVEVVVHGGGEDVARDRVVGFARAMGKEPIVVRDSPGFASSRLGVVLGLEAMRMVEQGVASAADIDTAMELGYKHPMGPLKLTDLVGLDVRLAIAETLHLELGGAQYEPPEILRKKVAAGELGKKTGRGFYDWE